ncbi:Redox-sensing transcriptional repressor rex [Bombilactobacillus mellifer]|uniref:Redox-sensing transcriptional repressor Rex n=1 Tax=Bombilactobacillus mellifer TaxID=1218492 RepID=A0A0F4LYJ0_9LACO|nr:redox-sensing transcriptional repressor Rex [Bombilactobacillus mellifer]MBH9991648.1 redox-sensing transcriptional repressor Rex [Lactobacillus sp. W8092]KJY62611.1 Redox-sensing transcriptional repressor rex [Bombilactobacillus mellifer]MCT6825884.1 redox-sensing transcriptional repressor Rex [Bombilactobacillus mellifer]MCT6843727.1 redox-sensing transcriptional repressor Rex [Bombilactobacillus mellifer]MCT6894175.1 redox-sensing transcriptional repressor Rex [Bombilactobacillus mellife
MAQYKIPNATIKRLPLYYRYFQFLSDSHNQKVSSTELAKAVQVDSATIRRDFSYFGSLGKRGYGYEVEPMVEFFKKLLNQDKTSKVALVGVGNLGHALLNYNFSQTNNIKIVAAFDSDPAKIGTQINQITVYDIQDVAQHLHEQQIDVVILSVPVGSAQVVTDRLVQAHVKGILNFTPLRISTPENVRVHNVDLANELQTLIYFLDNYSA